MSVRRWILTGGIAFTLCLVLAVYAFFDPSRGGFPQCPFRALTGFLCPGCGSQRAIHALLHGDVVSAFGYNAVLVLFLPLLAVLAIPVRYEPLRRLKRSVWLPRAVLLTVVVWWIGRNLV